MDGPAFSAPELFLEDVCGRPPFGGVFFLCERLRRVSALGHAPKCRVLNSKDLGVPDDMFSQYKWDHYPITFTIHC